MPGPAKPFSPGVSGNPAGRPKGRYTAEIAKAAREYTDEALERLVYWMRSDEFRASVPATKEILDRGFGKPAQEIIGLDGDSMAPRLDTSRMTDEQLGSLLRLLRLARTGSDGSGGDGEPNSVGHGGEAG